MASQKEFAVNPSVSITRSMFKRPSQHKTSLKLGEITPIYLEQDVLPGDTFKIKMSSLVRMITPIRPLMDNIHIDYYAFFCPNRLLWSHWKEFMGENSSSAGIYTGTEYVLPSIDISANGSRATAGSLGDHLGLPDISVGTRAVKVSALPFRMYTLVYNEWFRDQNLIAPIPLNVADTTTSDQLKAASSLLIAAKDSDYFTRALPYAQKGGAVTIPLGTSAPVYFDNATSVSDRATVSLMNPRAVFGSDESGSNENTITLISSSTPHSYDMTSENYSDVIQSFSGKLYGEEEKAFAMADLSEATAATINSLRFAFQYQKMLEKDAMFGTRYWEILKGHFGINAPDASLQRPQLLGSFRQRVNVDQVLQTTGFNATPSSNSLATPGANSVTGGTNDLFTFSAVEHGIIMILAVARHDQTYCQGIARGWTRSKRTDYYFPVFANLGAQTILNKEIYAQGGSDDDENFGYQEAWAEYRYKPSIVTSMLKPSQTNYAPWTLANNFGELPTLGKTFIEQGRANIARALTSGLTGPDFICDYFFDEVAVRPMPLYSVPGLIDHH